MKKKMSPHIIAAGAFVVFIVLGLACASTEIISTSPDRLYKYTYYDDDVTIVKYLGTSTDVEIPEQIRGKPVKYIAMEAFKGKHLTNVIIPASVEKIYEGAFSNNPLTSIVFLGSPTVEIDALGTLTPYFFANNRQNGTYTLDGNLWLYNGTPLVKLPAVVKKLTAYTEIIINGYTNTKNRYYVGSETYWFPEGTYSTVTLKFNFSSSTTKDNYWRALGLGEKNYTQTTTTISSKAETTYNDLKFIGGTLYEFFALPNDNGTISFWIGEAYQEAMQKEMELNLPAGQLLGTTWTYVDLENYNSYDVRFLEDGVLITLNDYMNNNSWVQNENSVTINFNNGYVIYNYKIINPSLMRGTALNAKLDRWKVELRKKYTKE